VSTSNSSEPEPGVPGRTTDGTGGVPGLSGVAAHLVRRAHQRHARLWAEEVGGDLTPPQYGVLQVVADDPGLDLTALGRRAAMDRTTVGRVADRLVAAGLLDRRPHPDDRRRATISLTDAGATMLARTTPGAAAANRRLLDAVPADQRDHLHDLLAVLAHEPDGSVQ